MGYYNKNNCENIKKIYILPNTNNNSFNSLVTFKKFIEVDMKGEERAGKYISNRTPFDFKGKTLVLFQYKQSKKERSMVRAVGVLISINKKNKDVILQFDKNSLYWLKKPITADVIKEWDDKFVKFSHATEIDRKSLDCILNYIEENIELNDSDYYINIKQINSREKMISQLGRFTSYVNYNDGHSGSISFRDSSGFLGREEGYKTRIAEEARNLLDFQKWNETWIGTGKIADCAKKAMSKADNLVNINQQIDFNNRLNKEHINYKEDGERVLFDIYCNPSCSDADAFKKAVDTFGAKYDTIAFLFFIKDDTRFLPISTGHFDKGFELLGIDYSTSHKCSWDNYIGFINIINNIRELIEETIPIKGILRLIDAHSFVWIIQQDRFINWQPDREQSIQIEQSIEEYLQKDVSGTGGRKKVILETFNRSSEVVRETRKRANGICQLCKLPAPFNDKKGNPYLEVHHIIWLSRGGEDSTNNTVALCPNCHARMHILDSKEDIEKLKKI